MKEVSENNLYLVESDQEHFYDQYAEKTANEKNFTAKIISNNNIGMITIDRTKSKSIDLKHQIKSHHTTRYSKYKDYLAQCFASNINKDFRLKLSIISFCCRRRNNTTNLRIKLYSNCINLIHYYTDFSIFIKKQIEFDMIKYCLFGKEERILLTLLSNPDLEMEDQDIHYKNKITFSSGVINQKHENDYFRFIIEKVLKKAKESEKTKRMLNILKDKSKIM